MHQMVIAQGTILDRIDHNIDTVVVLTESGKKNLVEVLYPPTFFPVLLRLRPFTTPFRQSALRGNIQRSCVSSS